MSFLRTGIQGSRLLAPMYRFALRQRKQIPYALRIRETVGMDASFYFLTFWGGIVFIHPRLSYYSIAWFGGVKDHKLVTDIQALCGSFLSQKTKPSYGVNIVRGLPSFNVDNTNLGSDNPP